MFTNNLYIAYFLQHIAATVLVDATVVVPDQFLFPLQKRLAQLHISTNNDFLLAAPPNYLKLFVWIELLFQLPFFFVAIPYFYHDDPRIYLPALVYGIEAALSTLVCVAEILVADLSNPDKLPLAAMYAAYMFVALYLSRDMYLRLYHYVSPPK